MKNKITVLISCLTLLGCAKQKTPDCTGSYQPCYLKASVIQTSDFSCNRPILDFAEDSVKIRLLTNTGGIHFSAIGLQSNLNILHQKLYVSVKLLEPGELYPCNDLGIYLFPLKVLDAIPVE